MNPRILARGRFPAACACAVAFSVAAFAAVGAVGSDSPAETETAASESAPSGKRPFTVDDLFQLEGLVEHYGGPFAFSPDGKKLAIARVRPKATWTDFKLDYLGTAGADVWVQLDAGKPLKNITNGIEDGSGWWAPQWSPDGERLAMLSTRGGNVCLWVWEAKTGELRQVTTRGIALQLSRPFIWLDASRLLYPALPAGERPSQMRVEIETPEIAAAMWPKVRQGREVTASVLESGVEAPASATEELLILDLDGTSRVVAQGHTRLWQITRARDAFAYARRAGRAPPAEGKELIGRAVWDADIAHLAGKDIVVHRSVARHILAHTLRWSPDGRSLALLHYEDERKLLALTRVSAGGRRQDRLILAAADTSVAAHLTHKLAWFDGKRALARYTRRGARVRNDWWFYSKDGAQECATCDMPAVPPDFIQLPELPGSLFGIASGDVWELQGAASKISNLTLALDADVRSIVPVASGSARKAHNALMHFVAQDTKGNAVTYARGWGLEVPRVLEAPDDDARPAVFNESSGTMVWVANNSHGLRVWRQDAGAGIDLLVDSNRQLRDIEEAPSETIDYVAEDGSAQKAWLILPAGFQKGRRYPLLTWVYAGATAERIPVSAWQLNNPGAYNLQIPAAAGYAVLIPSIPLAPEGSPDDPLLKLESGVMPAVTRLVELGIADPDRLFLMGHSYGGYTTLGLVTRTHRFRAAVAMASPSNLISEYGQLDPRHRYRADAAQRSIRQAMLESGQGRMGSPPWKDMNRYVRNSPVFAVDRVTTPVMIVMGDLDYVGMPQAEEFFMGLYRLGRRARFVRYWGEGHVLQSPANIRDLWSRVFAWFDDFSSSTPRPGAQ